MWYMPGFKILTVIIKYLPIYKVLVPNFYFDILSTHGGDQLIKTNI